MTNKLVTLKELLRNPVIRMTNKLVTLEELLRGWVIRMTNKLVTLKELLRNPWIQSAIAAMITCWMLTLVLYLCGIK